MQRRRFLLGAGVSTLGAGALLSGYRLVHGWWLTENAMVAKTPGDDGLDRLPSDKELGLLQFSTVLYYLHETNPDNGLVRDKTDPTAPVSIAAVGMALATIPVVVERGVLFRDFAAEITLKRLRFLLAGPQGPEADATGYKGFFYHFLDIETGRRVWNCELSTIDSAFLFAGALTVGTYFDRDTRDEIEIGTWPTGSTSEPTGTGLGMAARP